MSEQYFPENFFAATKEYNTYENHVPAPCIRKTFEAKPCKKAEITVCGLGFYQLFINGKEITKGFLAPYISNPDDMVYYDKYDVTDILQNGKNAVGLILGNGMQNCHGGRVWDFDIARFRSVPRFAMCITYTLENGETVTIDADESFKTAPSQILFDDLRSGVIVDAGAEQKGWSTPGFDDSAWCNVFKVEKPRGEYKICTASPIKAFKELKAKCITDTKICKRYNNRENMRLNTPYKFDFKDETAKLYDFGENTAGVLKIKIKGEKGQMLFIQACEFVNSKGEPSYQNIDFYPDGYAQTVRFICSGDEDEFVTPFCYFGMRYAVVYGLKEGQANDEFLTFLVCSSDHAERANFTCSNETMNTLGKMVRTSDLANFYYFPTDCPHREKNGWTGDAAASAERFLISLDCKATFEEWLRNIRKAQADNGSLPGIVPTGGWGFEWGNGPAWDNILTELCWQIYRIYGDLTPAKESSEAMLRYLSYVSQRRREDGLIAIGLGDWLQPLRGAGDPTAPLELTDSVMVVYIAEKSEKLFEALGLTMHRDFACELKNSVKKAIRDNLIDFSTMTVSSRCQTAQAICIYYGIFEQGEKARACDVLVDLIHEKNDHVDCGLIGLRTVFHTLSACGQGELAFKMITRRDFPSFGLFIDQGYTSLPENFIPEDETDSPASLNHHFFGDISNWFIQRVVGLCVNPKNNNADSLDITPDFIPSLNSAAGYCTLPCGRADVKWSKNGEDITLEITCPDKANGYIRLPKGYVFSDPERARGKLHYSCVTPLKAGTYTVIADKSRF